MARNLKWLSLQLAVGDAVATAFSATDLWVYAVKIQALPANAVAVFVGASTLTATNGYQVPEADQGYPLELNGLVKPHDHERMNLKDLYAYAAGAGNKLQVLYAISQEGA